MMMSPTSRTHKLIIQFIFQSLLVQTIADVWSEDIRIDVEAITNSRRYKKYVEPDIFIGTNLKWNNETVISAPEIVIEVLSMATFQEDMTTKLELYKEIGVNEYLLVSQEGLITLHNLNDTNYEDGRSIKNIFISEAIKGITIDFAKIFSLVKERIELFHKDI